MIVKWKWVGPANLVSTVATCFLRSMEEVMILSEVSWSSFQSFAGGLVNNSLDRGHGVDSSLEGPPICQLLQSSQIYCTPTGDAHDSSLGVVLGGSSVDDHLGARVNDGLGHLRGEGKLVES